MLRNPLLLLLALALPALVACSDDSEPQSGGAARAPKDRALVFTSFHPLQYVARRVGGELVDVRCPLPPGADPLRWSPSAGDVAAMQQADLLVMNGAGLEGWLSSVSLPMSKIVDASYPFRERFLTYDEAVTHSHGGGAAHTHKGVDPHTWLDPRNLELQAGEVLEALQRVLPQQRAALRTNYEALAADLQALAADFEALGQPPAGEHLYASHPAYNYLARRFEWPLVNLDLDPAAPLDDDEVADLRARLAKAPGRYLLWEEAPLPETVDRLREELGLESVVYSPAEVLDPGLRDAGVDYLQVQRANLSALRPAFEAP